MEFIVGEDGVGEDDIDALLAAVSGSDFEQIVGAVVTSARQGKVQAKRRSTSVFQAGQLPQSFVGIPLTTITASSTGQVIQVPIQRALRPDRFVLDRVQAASALVYDMKVGTVSLNASVNPVPGDMFAPDAVDTSIRATETATPAVGIQLTIGNRTATAITNLTGGFIGPSMKAN